MPQASSVASDDLASTDEIKVYKDEGEGEDEKRSENLNEEKMGLLTETEEALHRQQHKLLHDTHRIHNNTTLPSYFTEKTQYIHMHHNKYNTHGKSSDIESQVCFSPDDKNNIFNSSGVKMPGFFFRDHIPFGYPFLPPYPYPTSSPLNSTNDSTSYVFDIFLCVRDYNQLPK
ncbi:hypothetical protein HELRODRAFT_167857 [Helobdella robusta]|uniref:Uncharacterized protein n=1 Tax=Helobdella robusta TaxID=6412 RepID=T1EZV9_HELRO|nr:hypothetical protein HELRODRAFT_167857 [Helobdella robusta]ESO10020.1 hypothetical protein HELRODRAFT_167857 [Helobdella robusta]